MLHSNKNNALDFSGQLIYAGIDVHNKMWKVTVYVGGFEQQPITSPPEADALAKYLRRNFPGGNYKCAYEAGYTGFWISEELRKEGIECIVVNPSDVPSKDKEKRYKNDRIDSRKIARSLQNGYEKLIVDKSIEPATGQIVIAELNGEYIVKRIEKIKNKLYLVAGIKS